MKIKIGNLEISDVTPEELDELVKKYGGATLESTSQTRKATHKTSPDTGAPADTVLLRRFVEADIAGLTTIDVGTILGRRGKAARPAVKEWAKRVGLTKDGDDLEPFEDVRVGTQRGLRLKKSLLDVARHILGTQ